MTNGGQNWYPRWPLDGKWIVYTSAIPGTDVKDLDIYSIHVDNPNQIVKLIEADSREQ